jgi:hypothetical protein
LILAYVEEEGLRQLINPALTWHDLDSGNTQARATPLYFLKCPSQGDTELMYTHLPGETSRLVESNLAAHYTAVMGAKVIKNPAGSECPQVASDRYSLDCSVSGSGFVANNGIMYVDTTTKLCRTKPKDITDGLSKTFLIGEQSWDAGYHRLWIVGRVGGFVYSGNNLAHTLNTHLRRNAAGSIVGLVNDVSFGSKHPGGAHFAYADCSTKFFSENTAVEVLQVFASRANGEAITGE